MKIPKHIDDLLKEYLQKKDVGYWELPGLRKLMRKILNET